MLPVPIFEDFEHQFSLYYSFLIRFLRSLATENSLISIDFSLIFADKKELFPDSVHPNSEGCKIIAKTISKYLLNQVKIKRKVVLRSEYYGFKFENYVEILHQHFPKFFSSVKSRKRTDIQKLS